MNEAPPFFPWGLHWGLPEQLPECPPLTPVPAPAVTVSGKVEWEVEPKGREVGLEQCPDGGQIVLLGSSQPYKQGYYSYPYSVV